MIEITLNGKPAVIDPECTLAHALVQWNFRNGAFAVAINETFVARANYTEIILKTGDRVEIVTPMQGG